MEAREREREVRETTHGVYLVLDISPFVAWEMDSSWLKPELHRGTHLSVLQIACTISVRKQM